MTRRIDAGPLLALLGAVLLAVSLFLDWYEPSLTAWDIFELLDVVLLAVAAGIALAAAALLTAGAFGPDPRALPWLAGAAFVLVVVTLLDRPPVVGDGDPDVGVWLALAGAALSAAGAVMVAARVSVSFAFEPRERRTRVAAVDARAEAPAAEAVPVAEPPTQASPTVPLETPTSSEAAKAKARAAKGNEAAP